MTQQSSRYSAIGRTPPLGLDDAVRDTPKQCDKQIQEYTQTKLDSQKRKTCMFKGIPNLGLHVTGHVMSRRCCSLIHIYIYIYIQLYSYCNVHTYIMYKNTEKGSLLLTNSIRYCSYLKTSIFFHQVNRI